jgi:hypothetical protein
MLITEFLLYTENDEYLFTIIYDKFKEYGYYEDFLDILQYFVKHKKIKRVPEFALI